jgi:hypothetical protein
MARSESEDSTQPTPGAESTITFAIDMLDVLYNVLDKVMKD